MFSAANVAAAASASHTRLQEQAGGPDGLKIVDHVALYRAAALARFAAAAALTPSGTMILCADDFALINDDLSPT